MSDPKALFGKHYKFPSEGVEKPTSMLRKFGKEAVPAPPSDPVVSLISEAAASSRLLLPTDVAALLGVGVRTLERWRATGEGPRYVKLSSKTIRYTEQAIAVFVAERVKANTAS